MNKALKTNIRYFQRSLRNKTVALIVFFILAGIVGCNGLKSEDGGSSKNKKRQAEIEAMTKDNNDSSAEYFDWEAQRRLEKVAKDMAQETSPYQLILKLINSTEEYCWKALDVDTTFTPSWEKLGYLYAQVHGKQSMLRYNTYLKSGEKEKIKIAHDEAALNFAKAELYYNKALEFGTDDSAGIYFQKASAADIQKNGGLALVNMLNAVEIKPDNRKYETKLIESYMYAGMFEEALRQNEAYRQKYPESDFPFLILGGYYYFNGDTLKAMKNYKTAIKKGTKPEVAMLLHKYYSTHGDSATANFYLRKLPEIRATYNPEDY